MLRDLDNRQDTESPQNPTQKSRTGLASKIVVVSDSAETGRQRGSLYLGMVLIIVLAGAAGARWYTSQNVSLLRTPEQATLVVQPATNRPPISPVPRAETVVTLSPLPAIIESDNLQPEAVIEKSTVVAEASSPTRTPPIRCDRRTSGGARSADDRAARFFSSGNGCRQVIDRGV